MDNQKNTNNFNTFRNNHFNNIPQVYGDNKIVLMVRDPWTIYSYWEISRDIEDNVRGVILSRGLVPLKSILRVYDITEAEVGSVLSPVYDFELRDWANTWYIHADQSGRSWMCDIGILCTNGEFFCLARSNTVRTPLGKMADVTDHEWMCSEDLFKKMYAAAGGDNIGKSSLELQEIVERHLRSWMSSGGSISSEGFGSSDMFNRK